MDRETLKNVIDLVPETEPLPDEVVAITKAEEDDETIDHDSINWDSYFPN